MIRNRTAAKLICRIRDHYARVHVLVTEDGAYHVRAQAVCPCKWHAPARSGVDPGRAVQLASDDAFTHRCQTGHRIANPRVRMSSIDHAPGRSMTRLSNMTQVVPITSRAHPRHLLAGERS